LTVTPPLKKGGQGGSNTFQTSSERVFGRGRVGLAMSHNTSGVLVGSLAAAIDRQPLVAAADAPLIAVVKQIEQAQSNPAIYQEGEGVKQIERAQNNSAIYQDNEAAPAGARLSPFTLNESAMTTAIERSRGGCVCILDKKRVVGLFSERELVRCIVQDMALHAVSVAAAMTPVAIAINASNLPELSAVLDLFRQHQLQYLPVLDDNGDLAGLLAAEVTQQLLCQHQHTELIACQQAQKKLEDRLQQQKALTDIGRHTLLSRAVNDLLNEVVGRIARTLEVPCCGVFALLPNQSTFLLRAGVGWQPGLVDHATISPGRKSLVGYTVLAAEPVVVSNLQLETRFSGTPLLHNHGAVSCASVVIPSQATGPNDNFPYGVLVVHTHQPREFSSEEIQLLQAAAELLGMAIARQQSEEELERFFHLSLDLFGIAELSGDFKRINPRFTEILGYPEATLLAQPWLDFVHADDRAATQTQLTQLSHGIPAVNFKNRCRCQDGSYRWLHWTIQPYDAHLLCAVGRDITEQKRVEDALRHIALGLSASTSEAFFQSLVISLARALSVEYALVAEIAGTECTRSQTIAFCAHGKIEENFIYDLAGTPCAEVRTRGSCVYRDRVQEQFPQDNWLRSKAIESYLGISLFDTNDEVMAWIGVMDTTPMAETAWMIEILQIVAARARGELERRQADAEIQHLNQVLEHRIELRTAELKQTNEQLRVEILERHQIEFFLAESEEQFRSIVNQAAVGIALGTPKGHLLMVNQKLCDLLGYKEEELTQLLWQDLSHPDDREQIDLQVGKVLQGELQTVSAEQQYLRKEGSSLWAHLTFSLIRDATGRARYTLSVIQDIRDRKQAELALRRSETRFRAIFEQAAVGIVRNRLDGQFIQANQKFLEIAGYSWEALQGKTFLEITHPDDRPSAEANLETMLLGQQSTLIAEKRYITQANQVVWAEVTASLVRSPTGEPDYFIAVVQDIRDRKQAEADMLRALAKEKELNDLKSRFISMTSHEFRTPLTVISSSTGLLADYGDRLDTLKKKKHLQRIQSAVDHMTQLLEDVLTISHVETNSAFNPAPLDLAAFCRDLVDEMQANAPQHAIALSLNDEAIEACMDAKLLRQILANLLSNAIKYSPQGSRIDFEVTAEDKTVTFYIRDRGIGIPLADRSQIFELFHRGENVGKLPGTGLGLAIVKKCVDLHQGHISVESPSDGGTAIAVKLPLTSLNR